MVGVIVEQQVAGLEPAMREERFCGDPEHDIAAACARTEPAIESERIEQAVLPDRNQTSRSMIGRQ